MKVLGLIPAYNENKAERVAVDTAKFVDKVILIDDGSDNPVRQKKEYIVLRNNQRRGKGYSLKRGFDYAIKKGYDVVITLDGDGEHNPKDIPLFLQKLKSNDIVVGQRIAYRSVKRSILNKWVSSWLRLLLPSIKDAQCGFFALKKDLLKKLKITSSGFSIDLELLLESFKNNARMGFVSLKTKNKKYSFITLKDYIKINNLFDLWIIENYKEIQVPRFKKILLLNASFVGLVAGRALEWILERHY